MIITRTPYRLSLFGGGTDYPDWYSLNPCRILSASMQHYCYITVRDLPPFFGHRSRVVYSKVEEVSFHKDIQHGGVRACLDYLSINEGLEIHHDGDLPARSGIGSSSAFVVGLLHALYAYQGRLIETNVLAEQSIEIEKDILGEAVGVQDQIMAAHGGIRIIDMGPNSELSSTPLFLSHDYIKYFESHFLLGYSGISRTGSDFAEEKIQNIKNKKTESELYGLSEIAENAINLIAAQSEMQKIGELLSQSWILKRQLASHLLNDWMDELIATGIQAGAFGGKIMGAGGGGFFYFVAPPEKHAAIKLALPNIKVWVPVRIAKQGTQIIFNS